MNALRHGSVIDQLENDQYNELEGADDLELGWKRGHNAIVRFALVRVRAGQFPAFNFVNERDGDEVSRAFRRGVNAGIRHVRHVMNLAAGLGELAHAPVIRTVELEPEGIDLRLKHALVNDEPGKEP